MDTDMYLLKNPSNIISSKELVFSIQDPNVIISAGFIAACPNQKFISKAVNLYNNVHYSKGEKVASRILCK